MLFFSYDYLPPRWDLFLLNLMNLVKLDKKPNEEQAVNLLANCLNVQYATSIGF